MVRRILLAAVVGGLASIAFAQSNTNDNQSVADRSPAENVRPGPVAERSPGNSVIRPALQRHAQLQNERLHGGGNDNDNGSGSGSSNDNSASGSSTAGTDDLAGLLSSLTGGSSGSLGSLTSLLGNAGVQSLLSSGALSSILGGSLGSMFSGETTGNTTGTTPATTGNTTTGSTGIGNTSGITPEQQAQLDYLLQLRDSSNAGSTAKSQQSTSANAGRGVVAGEQKTNARSQATDEEEDSFRVRLYDSWLGTTFAALTVFFSSRTYIDTIKDSLRDLFDIPAPVPTTQPSGGSQVRHIDPMTERMAHVVRVA